PAPTTPEPSATTPPAASAASVPEECEAYLTKVNACMDKLGSSNPAAASIKQQLESAKSQWAAIPDKTQLAAQCKQSADLFAQSATQMGCP
ncbi:MAG: glutaconyl-CoA decarboxylase subunit gamma, partial [Achromobacter sp.]|nr:glutaconyl-CoA decarboxylase subunit gamma [Achromobacter sp.]